jgi:hypothetical protein
MKKLAIFLAIMLIPFSAFALDTISDNDLNDVTGQAGVSIYTNSINIVKTAVTTVYTDDANEVGGDNQFTIVAEATDTSIYFGGVDPIMIDIIEMNTLDTLLAACNMDMDSNDYGETGVQITLPDSITIVNNIATATKSYYTGTTIDDSNRLISVTTNGGTTTIQQATKGFSAAFTSISGTGLRHDDQLKIIISAHDGDG